MGARGRVSTAAQEIKVIDGGFTKRHEPPSELNKDEVEIWNRTLSTEPPEFFDSAAARDALKLYCSCMAEAQRITQTMREFETPWLKSEDGIRRYKLLGNEKTKAIQDAIRCARALRLTNHSRYRADRAGVISKQSKAKKMPWDFDAEED